MVEQNVTPPEEIVAAIEEGKLILNYHCINYLSNTGFLFALEESSIENLKSNPAIEIENEESLEAIEETVLVVEESQLVEESKGGEETNEQYVSVTLETKGKFYHFFCIT